MNQTEKKKKAILETTFHLLNQKTIREITVDEIAQKAGVSKVTLFKYFHSKNQLINQVIRQDLNQLSSEIKALFENNLDFNQTYQAILQLKVHRLEHYQPIYSENMMTQYTNSPELLDDDTRSLQNQIYLTLFQKGQSEGKISKKYSQEDFFLILNIFNSGIKGLSLTLLLEKSEIISRFFLNGWK
ncbi:MULTISPECIES: TetR/AcrR family transcriptional regulator [Lactococcus]|uniref:TetR/AcrR family transcriptional regulator n=1 Tax=Lactococcus TaxID=1357 RepID=UPI001CDD7D38|nr:MULTISPECIES: TetR/AcrR family transcriptional regulator [Lactococcus]MCA2389978.1 TetR/AcrR family transcriptional regulator [Lactococcus sp. NH2-7C]MCI1071341.1 TetR/AcrR family transcriptional regulator [Lactococcus lactis]MCT1194717.1 TetR/AcrR family transcriptional regulator [Lactococcus lactis]WGV30326.1 TetR/AcrR family transcriptional regulator [Lactococcus sp. NH2-7C]